MRYNFDLDEVREAVCDGCELVKMTHNGKYRGEQIDPPEYDCPCEFDPTLIIDDEALVCSTRCGN